MKQTHQPGDGSRGPRPDDGSARDVVAALAEVDALFTSLAPDLAPERIPGHQLAAVVTALGSIERRVRGARLVLRKAAADTGAWKAAGARSAAEHVAKQEGISVGQARAELAASERLASLPAAREATTTGEISVEKAKAVAEAAAADPTAEGALVAAARSGDLRDTQDEARRTIARADERSGERALRVHRRRSLKTWLSVDGEGHGVWNIPAEAHHRFLAALEPYRRQVFRDTRANGVRLSDEAMMADALDLLARDVLLDANADADADGPDPVAAAPPPRPSDRPPGPVEGGTPDARPRAGDTPSGGDDEAEPSLFPAAAPEQLVDAGAGADTAPAPAPVAGPAEHTMSPPPRRRHRRAPAQVTVMVDYDALVRGHSLTGETCEITGLGPVPVSLVRAMVDDCFLRLVVTGRDVTVVSSQRRYVPADLRAALWARDRGTCVVPGCHATRGLEIDHCRVDFARDGPTALWNSALLCKVHHVLKTVGGWVLGGGHEEGWTFTPPDIAPQPP